MTETVAPTIPCTIESVNLGQRRALLSDGRFVPITDLYNIAGEKTRSIRGAVNAIAGQDGIGWWPIDLTQYERDKQRTAEELARRA